jgi:hypothetical protein
MTWCSWNMYSLWIVLTNWLLFLIVVKK